MVIWSRCPSSYVVLFQCENVDSTEVRKCPIEDVIIDILLPRDPADGDPDDVLMYRIAQDLKSATGVPFGSESFRWLFLYGGIADGPCDGGGSTK